MQGSKMTYRDIVVRLRNCFWQERDIGLGTDYKWAFGYISACREIGIISYKESDSLFGWVRKTAEHSKERIVE